MPICHAHFWGFGDIFPQIWSAIVLIYNKTILARKHVVWAINMCALISVGTLYVVSLCITVYIVSLSVCLFLITVLVTNKRMYKAWKSVQRFDLGAGSRKKVRTGQDSQKKSQSDNISPIWEKPPWPVPIKTTVCMAGNLADVITCTKFQDDIFRGYNCTSGGVSNFPFFYCAACDTSCCVVTCVIYVYSTT